MSEIPVTEATKLFPQRNGKHPAVKTLRRWMRQGVRGIKLQGKRIGNLYFTSPECVKEFMDRCSGRKTASAKERAKRLANAKDVLKNYWGIDCGTH